MAEHKFKIGQFVYFQPQWPGHALPGRYQIVRRLRNSGRVSHYAIRVPPKITNVPREKAS